MEKPTGVVVQEFKENIANLINVYRLHPSIMEPILKSVWVDIANAAAATYEQEKAQYEKAIADDEAQKAK